MNRGQIWTVASGPHYSSKPRPAVVLQADRYTDLDSIIICLFTSDDTRAPFVRILGFPTKARRWSPLRASSQIENGLRLPCWLMIDKIAAVPRTKLRSRIDILDADTLAELNRAVTIFLQLDGGHPPRAPRRR